MTVNDATGYSHEPALTTGEQMLMQKLEELQEQMEELIEKVNNLNLTENEGYSTYDG